MLNRQTSSHHLLLEMGQLHVPIPVPPNHLPSVNEVPKIEVLEPIMVNGLALSPSADVGKERVREEAISPAELVAIDIEGNSEGDYLMRKAGSMRWFGNLTTPRTRSGSTGRSLVMGRGDGGGLAMDHAEDGVHIGRRVVEGHASVLWVVVLVGVAECGMMGTCQPMSSPYMFPTSEQQYSIIPTTPIIHHRPPLYQQCPYAPMSIQLLSSIPSDCFRSINPQPLASSRYSPSASRSQP